jgi:hypothetical protein
MRIPHLGQYGPQGQFLGPVPAYYSGEGSMTAFLAPTAASAPTSAQISTTEAPMVTYSVAPAGPIAPTGTLGPLVVPGPVIPSASAAQEIATVPGSDPIPGIPVLSPQNIAQPLPDITATLAPLPAAPSLWCDVNVWIGDNSILAVGLLAAVALLLWPKGRAR